MLGSSNRTASRLARSTKSSSGSSAVCFPAASFGSRGGASVSSQVSPPSLVNRATPWAPTAQPVLRSRKWTDLMGAEVPVVCILHVSPLSSVFITVPKVPTAQPRLGVDERRVDEGRGEPQFHRPRLRLRVLQEDGDAQRRHCAQGADQHEDIDWVESTQHGPRFLGCA